MTTEEKQHDNIIDALAAAQGEFPEIPKSKTAHVVSRRTNTTYDYKYADLADVLAATRPILSKHKLAVSWVFRQGPNGGEVVTRLLFNGSDPLESVIPVYYEKEMQELGKAVTYAKRYGLCGLIGVCAEDDDDCQNAAPAKQERRQTEQRQQRQQTNGAQQTRERTATERAGDAKPAHPPAQTGEKKPLIYQVKDKIEAAPNPEAIIEIMRKSAEKWPDKEPLLTDIFNICAEENIARAMNGFPYDHVGEQRQWDEDDRKWVFGELSKIMDGLGKEPAGQSDEPADWPSRIAAVTKSDELFTIIHELAEDADLTSDMNAFNAVCGLITAKLDANAAEWGDGATKISRQFLSNRITAVELDHAAKEAMNNATAS